MRALTARADACPIRPELLLDAANKGRFVVGYLDAVAVSVLGAVDFDAPAEVTKGDHSAFACFNAAHFAFVLRKSTTRSAITADLARESRSNLCAIPFTDSAIGTCDHLRALTGIDERIFVTFFARSLTLGFALSGSDHA